MRIFHLQEEPLNWTGCVLTIGVFDGVHLGHKFVLETLTNVAAESNLPSAVLSFNQHPQLFLGIDPNFKLLNTPVEKLSLLSQTLVNTLIVCDFKRITSLSYQEFIDSILDKQLKVKTLLLGHNQKMGKGGEGTLERIMDHCSRRGIRVIVLQKLSENIHISSSEIRKALMRGEVLTANSLLGYNYSFEAVVVGGKKLGRELGFPTANLQPTDPLKIMPAPGVYAVRVFYNSSTYSGIMNYGLRPTIEQGNNLVAEIHILDFNEDLYNQVIRVELVEKIRNEIEFPTIDALVQQIEKDIIACLSILNSPQV